MPIEVKMSTISLLCSMKKMFVNAAIDSELVPNDNQATEPRLQNRKRTT